MAKGKETVASAPATSAANGAPASVPVVVGVASSEGAKATPSPALLKLTIAARLSGTEYASESRPLSPAGAIFASSGEEISRVSDLFFTLVCSHFSAYCAAAAAPAFLDLPGGTAIFDANAAVRYLLAPKVSDSAALGSLDTWTEWEDTTLAPAVAQGGVALQNALQAMEKDVVRIQLIYLM